MSKRVVVEPDAEADVLEAYAWYQQQRVGLGDDFLLCFEAALAVIQEPPGLSLACRGGDGEC